jgi:hypothetical protein
MADRDEITDALLADERRAEREEQMAEEEADRLPQREPGGSAALVTGIVLGALLGAGIALLFAPDRGTKTRRRVGRHLRRWSEEAADTFDDTASRARRELTRRRRRLGL